MHYVLTLSIWRGIATIASSDKTLLPDCAFLATVRGPVEHVHALRAFIIRE
jgi:hypothetical protein